MYTTCGTFSLVHNNDCVFKYYFFKYVFIFVKTIDGIHFYNLNKENIVLY